MTLIEEARRYRAAIENAMVHSTDSITEDQALEVGSLYPVWKPGQHKAGERYQEGGQIWEAIQDYDNAVYPDIAPGKSAWGTFNRPLHGTTPETARAWVQPTGAHDIYHVGQYMIYTDGLVYRCTVDTNFSPEEFGGAWEVA